MKFKDLEIGDHFQFVNPAMFKQGTYEVVKKAEGVEFGVAGQGMRELNAHPEEEVKLVTQRLAAIDFS